MKAVTVSLRGRPYRVLVGRGLLGRVGTLVRRRLGTGAMMVISSAPLRRRFGRVFGAGCRRAGVAVRWLAVPDGERAKSPAVLVGLLRGLARAGAGRDTVVCALGGGTVSDLAGLAAALYTRGLRWVAVPTTLEAQVDAAIGGKTAVNLPEGKNLVGAFHQPSLVIADPAVLRSLPARQRRAGLAEVVKYGAIRSPALFARLERDAARLAAGDPTALERVVGDSAAIKAAVVARDEHEGGARLALNFGHTAGHALEAATGYGRLLHGEAVAIGMVAAAALSVRHGLCAPAVATRIVALLRALGLPVRAPRGLPRRVLRRALGLDKKRVGGRLRLVLLTRIGDHTVLSGMGPDDILNALARGAAAGRQESGEGL